MHNNYWNIVSNYTWTVFSRYIDLDSGTDDYDESSHRPTMIHQVVATFLSYPFEWCYSRMLIITAHMNNDALDFGTTRISWHAKFCSPSQLVPAESQVGTIQLKCNSSVLNEARDMQAGFLSFLNYYYLITSANFNKQTTNFIASKSHKNSMKSAKIKQSSSINWRSSSEQVSHFWLFHLRIIINW